MKGIVIASHGELAKEMENTLTLFFGNDIQQFDNCCLLPTDTPEAFYERLLEKVKKVDSGDGVILLVDVFGGTPCNQSAFLIRDYKNVQVITGMNLPMLMELLGNREEDIEELITASQQGIQYLNELFCG